MEYKLSDLANYYMNSPVRFWKHLITKGIALQVAWKLFLALKIPVLTASLLPHGC